MSRKVVLYISMSLDGYIASKNNDLSWLSIVESENEDYGYNAFNESVDTYIVGRKNLRYRPFSYRRRFSTSQGSSLLHYHKK